VADILAARRQLLEDRIEAARHDLDGSVRAQRLAFEELAAIRRAARSCGSSPSGSEPPLGAADGRPGRRLTQDASLSRKAYESALRTATLRILGITL
jgi:hypothetical protein